MLTRSSVQFYVDAKFGPDPIVGGAVTHVRDGAGYARDFDRVMRSKRRNQYRTEWETIAAEHRPIMLLELARANRCTESRDFSAWANTNTTLTTGQADPERGTGGTLITSTSAAGLRKLTVPFSATGVKTISVELKPGSAAVTRVGLYDATAAAFKHAVDISWASINPGSTSGLATASGSGTIVPLEQLADGWYRVSFSTASVTHTNTNEMHILPHATSTGSVYVFDVHVEDGAYPTRKIPTDGAASARPTDQMYYANPPGPGGIALYQSFLYTGDRGDSPYRALLYPLTGTGSNYIGIKHDASGLNLVFNNGTGEVGFATSDQTPAAGDLLEYALLVQGADALLLVRKNLLSITENGTSTLPSMPSAWEADGVLWLNGYQTNNSGVLKLERIMWANADDMIFQQGSADSDQILNELATFHLGANGEVIRA